MVTFERYWYMLSNINFFLPFPYKYDKGLDSVLSFAILMKDNVFKYVDKETVSLGFMKMKLVEYPRKSFYLEHLKIRPSRKTIYRAMTKLIVDCLKIEHKEKSVKTMYMRVDPILWENMEDVRKQLLTHRICKYYDTKEIYNTIVYKDMSDSTKILDTIRIS